MKIDYLILILFGSLISACSSTEPQFPIEESLAQELMPLQGITYPIGVEVKHPFLIFKNIKRTDSLFHIYDLRDRQLKSVFGVIGEGPGELVAAHLFRSQLSDILICDLEKNWIYSFSINEKGESMLKDIKQSGCNSGLYDAAFINDSLFVADPKYMLVPSLYLLGMQDTLPRKIWTYRNPDILDYTFDPDKGSVYANNDRIVFCYGYKKQIDIMDTSFNLIRRVEFNYNSPTNITDDNYEDIKTSYSYAYLGERYLYALFLGTTWPEHSANSTCGTYLEVFDLDGNPKARYHLEGRRPMYFAVDEETFTLYGAGEEGDPEDNLLVYNLKGLT